MYNKSSLIPLSVENKRRKITSPCRLSTHSEGVEFSYQSTVEVWTTVKGGKFFYFVPSCYLIFIPHPTFHALSNSDTSTLPTHAMPNWFELHKSASRIYFLANLFPCVMASPFISCTDLPESCTCLLQAAMGSLVYFCLNRMSIDLLGSVFFIPCPCKCHSVLWRPSSWLYIFLRSEPITATEFLNSLYWTPELLSWASIVNFRLRRRKMTLSIFPMLRNFLFTCLYVVSNKTAVIGFTSGHCEQIHKWN